MRKLTLSPKSTIVASHYKLAVAAANELGQHDIKFAIQRSARDLGLDNTAARQRPSKQLTTRIQNVKERIGKITKLAQISRRARQFFSGSAMLAAVF